MRVFEKTFQNEWQNHVALQIEHLPHVDRPAEISIVMVGPHSAAEHTITIMEARELQAALAAVLRYRNIG